jgi:predicted transcriptional regulator
MTPVARDL